MPIEVQLLPFSFIVEKLNGAPSITKIAANHEQQQQQQQKCQTKSDLVNEIFANCNFIEQQQKKEKKKQWHCVESKYT